MAAINFPASVVLEVELSTVVKLLSFSPRSSLEGVPVAAAVDVEEDGTDANGIPAAAAVWTIEKFLHRNGTLYYHGNSMSQYKEGRQQRKMNNRIIITLHKNRHQFIIIIHHVKKQKNHGNKSHLLYCVELASLLHYRSS